MALSHLTRLRFRLALWCHARLLPLRVRRRPLCDVLALAPLEAGTTYRGLPLPYILKHVRRTVRKPLFMRDRRCLREGLLAFRFMAAAGYEPELHFGIDRKSVADASVKAHCWVVHGGEAVLNSPDDNMVRILVHGGAAPHNSRSDITSD
jgi:hypothetical protein